jgi:hypothetical protein
LGARTDCCGSRSATAVEVASDPLLAGADRLAFLSDPDKLYVNTGKLLRLDLAKDGKVTKITDLKLSRPLEGPDGMRPIDGKHLIIAEGILPRDIQFHPFILAFHWLHNRLAKLAGCH